MTPIRCATAKCCRPGMSRFRQSRTIPLPAPRRQSTAGRESGGIARKALVIRQVGETHHDAMMASVLAALEVELVVPDTLGEVVHELGGGLLPCLATRPNRAADIDIVPTTSNSMPR